MKTESTGIQELADNQRKNQKKNIKSINQFLSGTIHVPETGFSGVTEGGSQVHGALGAGH